uniref:Disease resistance R13L4/SHOC-2-like LRR domain-containing protein n=1 Tax=Rhizophora mucronata TaxID=61149 RepID=A0A2P2J9D2_RHIMU
MAREIVRKECYEEPGQRSRLWLHSDINHVLMNDTGTEKVEGIVLNSSVANKISFCGKSLLKMTKLRLLRLRSVQLSCGLEYFPSELRYLELDQYPFKYSPPTLQLDKLVELRMKSSNIEKFLLKTKPIQTLKVLDLSDSQNLARIAGFESIPNLKRLILCGCPRLIEVNESIGVLKMLLRLNLEGCESLVELPNGICDLESLKTLNLDGCTKLRKLPERFGDIPSLEKLSVSGIAESQLVSAKPWDFIFGHRPAKNINPVASMLSSFSALQRLTELNLSACNLSEGVIPTDLSGFPSLQSLNLSGNDFVSIPTSIIQLSKLEKVSLINCKQLQSLPDLPLSLILLRVDDCTSLRSFPNPIEKRTLAPWILSFVNCKLNGIQGAFSWLRSYFNFLLKCKQLVCLSLPAHRLLYFFLLFIFG